MAVTVAAAYVNNSGGGSVTSGNFNLVANDLYVLVAHSDATSDTVDVTWTLTDNQTPDLTWTLIIERDGVAGDEGGVVAYYMVPSAPVTGYNVTVAVAGDGADSPAVKVYRVPAGEFDSADVVGASTGGNLSTDPQNTASITPETSGVGIAAWIDWNETGSATSSDLTLTSFDTSGQIAGGSGFKSLTAAVGATANMNFGGTPTGNYIWFEIRAGAGGGGSTTTKTMSDTSSLTDQAVAFRRRPRLQGDAVSPVDSFVRVSRWRRLAEDLLSVADGFVKTVIGGTPPGTYVNGNVATFGTNESTTSVAAALDCTEGNTLVACFSTYDSTQPSITGITDTAGNTWQLLVATFNPSDANHRMEIWRAKNIAVHAANVVTGTYSALCEFRSLAVAQYTGALDLDTAGTYLADTWAFDTTNYASSASVSPVTSATLLVGFYINFSGNPLTSAVGVNGSTLRLSSSSDAYLLDKTGGAGGSPVNLDLFTAGTLTGDTGSYATLSVALKSAAGGPSVTQKTMSDAIAVTDPQIQWARRYRVAADSLDAIDSIVKTLSGGAAVITKVMSDTLAVADSVIQWLRRVRGPIDSVTLSDGDTYRNSIITASEAIDLTDNTIAWLRLKRVAQDSIDLIDGFSKTLGGAGIVYAKVMSDTVTLIDDAGRRWRLRFAQLTDAVGLSDQVLDYLRAVRSLGDVVELSDGAVKVRRMIKSVDESIEVSDGDIATLYRDQVSNTSFSFGSSGPPFRFGGM